MLMHSEFVLNKKKTPIFFHPLENWQRDSLKYDWLSRAGIILKNLRVIRQ